MLSRSDYIPACVAGIELFIFGAETLADAPVVFVAHGRGGSAAASFGLCRQIAARGMIGVAFDQRNHGRRMVDQRWNDGWSVHHAADMYGACVGTALDVSLLIDMLPARLGIATDRVGMTGVSMGGHVTLLAMALDMRIAVGAPIIGSGDYRRLMERRAADHGCPAEDFHQFFPPALARAVERYDPIHHPDRFADRPLFMANGEADTLVPLECNTRLLAALRPHYTHAERLVLQSYPGVGHACPTEMIADMLSWLRRWLIDDPAQ